MAILGNAVFLKLQFEKKFKLSPDGHILPENDPWRSKISTIIISDKANSYKLKHSSNSPLNHPNDHQYKLFYLKLRSWFCWKKFWLVSERSPAENRLCDLAWLERRYDEIEDWSESAEELSSWELFPDTDKWVT